MVVGYFRAHDGSLSGHIIQCMVAPRREQEAGSTEFDGDGSFLVTLSVEEGEHMGEVFYVSKSHFDRKQGPLRIAHLQSRVPPGLAAAGEHARRKWVVENGG